MCELFGQLQLCVDHLDLFVDELAECVDADQQAGCAKTVCQVGEG